MWKRNLIQVFLLAVSFTGIVWGTDRVASNFVQGDILLEPATKFPGQVLGLETFIPPTIIPQLPTPLPELIEEIQNSKADQNTPVQQKKVRLLLLGDSMIDFLNDFPHLRDILRSLNPNTEWEILNYGVGASNVGYGLYRVNSEYDYMGRHFSSVIGVNPDIVVVESFAYNHGDMPESQYQDSLKRIFSALKEANKKIIFLATIAPNKANYARGAADWGDEYRSKEYEKTRRFVDLGIDAARELGIPIVDAFHQSLDGEKGGNEKYIYGGDWIHPSPEGAEFIAKLLGPTIVSLVE